jgi:hypothetical protein
MGKSHAGTGHECPPSVCHEKGVSGETYLDCLPFIPIYLLYSYVFDNYTWDRDGPEYSTFNGKLIPSRIPLSAMISGRNGLVFIKSPR